VIEGLRGDFGFSLSDQDLRTNWLTTLTSLVNQYHEKIHAGWPSFPGPPVRPAPDMFFSKL